MLTEDAEIADGEKPSEADLRAAADQARADVAASPRDEAAATRLREAVRCYRDAYPPSPAPDRPDAPAVIEARRLIEADELEDAEILLRKHLEQVPHDPPAMHMMAQIASRCGLLDDADRILTYSASLRANDPDGLALVASTWHHIGVRADRPEFIYKAAQAFDRALQLDPVHQRALANKAEMMMQTRGLEQAQASYRKLLDNYQHLAQHWLNYGHLLSTLGRAGESVAAMRTALALDPGNGSWWWMLSDLRNVRLFAEDIAEMEAALERPDLPDGQRVPLHFALGTAYDSGRDYERAIGHIERGSEVRAGIERPDLKPLVPDSEFIRKTFTREFFAERQGWGDPRPGPIFILGMHRAGSTLVEQILSSHSQIEGSEELFIITRFASEIESKSSVGDRSETIEALQKQDFRTFGERYFDLSARSRRTNRPYLSDKYPGNWKFVGLIHCMLPNARIIDVRRNPMDCCFANYFRYYGSASDHSFSQAGMGRFYADYVEAMRHFDAVLPGRIHRVIHDDLVDDLEGEVRRLLDYIGVPFEETCLRFFETERAVHTPSAEQVREPINRKGFGKWRNYEQWLGEMKKALGPSLDDWR